VVPAVGDEETLSPMQSKDLKPGDVFYIPDHRDPESPVRVCLTNDVEHGLRFGFPNKPGYWCYMGEAVPVVLVWKE